MVGVMKQARHSMAYGGVSEWQVPRHRHGHGRPGERRAHLSVEKNVGERLRWFAGDANFDRPQISRERVR